MLLGTRVRGVRQTLTLSFLARATRAIRLPTRPASPTGCQVGSQRGASGSRIECQGNVRHVISRPRRRILTGLCRGATEPGTRLGDQTESNGAAFCRERFAQEAAHSSECMVCERAAHWDGASSATPGVVSMTAGICQAL